MTAKKTAAKLVDKAKAVVEDKPKRKPAKKAVEKPKRTFITAEGLTPEQQTIMFSVVDQWKQTLVQGTPVAIEWLIDSLQACKALDMPEYQ